MKNILSLLAATLLTLAANSQTTLVASNTTLQGSGGGAKTGIVADEVLNLKETEFDFGKIPQGKPVTLFS